MTNILSRLVLYLFHRKYIVPPSVLNIPCSCMVLRQHLISLSACEQLCFIRYSLKSATSTQCAILSSYSSCCNRLRILTICWYFSIGKFSGNLYFLQRDKSASFSAGKKVLQFESHCYGQLWYIFVSLKCASRIYCYFITM